MKTLLYPLLTKIEEINHNSGTTVSIYNCLKKYFNVIPVGPLKLEKPIIQTGLNYLYKKGYFPYQFATVHTWKTINSYSEQLQKYIDKLQFDAIFSSSTLYSAKVTTNKPVFAYADFSFCNLLNYYPQGMNLFPASRKQALSVDKYCFENYTKVFLASEWAKQTTINTYGLEEDKICTIKRGANLESNLNKWEIDELIKSRANKSTKNFLFMGVNWSRKGGNVACSLVSKLVELGYDVKLQVVGCTPPDEIKKLSFVSVFPFLSRKNENEFKLLNELFYNAFCFILPTQAEAMGIAFAEAASFGLPSIAFDTGGVSAAIENEKTGILFNMKDSMNVMLTKTLPLLENNSFYQNLSKNAYTKYTEELNWNSIAIKIRDIITPLL